MPDPLTEAALEQVNEELGRRIDDPGATPTSRGVVAPHEPVAERLGIPVDDFDGVMDDVLEHARAAAMKGEATPTQAARGIFATGALFGAALEQIRNETTEGE